MSKKKIKSLGTITLFILLFSALFISWKTTSIKREKADLIDPILFALVVPPLHNSSTFGHMAESFNNQGTGMDESPRGGDLALMLTGGSVRLLTEEAGFGVGSGEIQAENAIAVREPSVHWGGCKALFSMIVGGPPEAFRGVGDIKWQIYEITNLCDVIEGATANIVKVADQPDYNNLSPIYGKEEGKIHFISDQPYNSLHHTYPPRDEYESTPTNSGIFTLNRDNGETKHLTHSPSGDFDLFIARDGRLLFTRWSHVKADGQEAGNRNGSKPSWKPFNYVSEESDEIEVAPETKDGKPFADAAGVRYVFFPEPGNDDYPTFDPKRHVNRFNEFQIWEMLENGEKNQTINHIGRHEYGGAFTGGTFVDDPNLVSYLEGTIYTSNTDMRNRVRGFHGFFQVTEDMRAGKEANFYFSYGPEFGTFAAGLMLRSYVPTSMNPEDVIVEEVTGPNDDYQLGRFRDPLILSDGTIIVSHAAHSGRYNRDEGRDYHFQLNVLEEGNFIRSPLTGAGYEKEIVYWGDSEVAKSITLNLMELWPVAVVGRDVPEILPKYQVDPIEMEVIEEESVDIDELRNWLIENDLAMLVIRDVTKRDRADVQQPYNLRVPNGVESISSSGDVYDISYFQPVQFELLRGYYDRGSGRRTFPLPFRNTGSHDNLESINPYDPEGPENSLKIESDGSVAFFVPAVRALAWASISPEGESIVRERQPLSFAAGEIMTCAGCHGINKETHDGSLSPTNKPEALRKLLIHWKARNEDPGSVTSLKDYLSKLDIGVYPNPTTDLVTLSNLKNVQKAQVISATGKVSMEFDINSEEEKIIDVQNLSPGTYVIKILYNDGKHSSHKFVKQ